MIVSVYVAGSDFSHLHPVFKEINKHERHSIQSSGMKLIESWEFSENMFSLSSHECVVSGWR